MTPEPGWRFTGKNMDDGRPIWACRVCNSSVWGWRIAEHVCNGVLIKRKKSSDLPCIHRGMVYGKVNCCETAFTCSKHGFCVMNAVVGTIASSIPVLCATCADRKESHE